MKQELRASKLQQAADTLATTHRKKNRLMVIHQDSYATNILIAVCIGVVIPLALIIHVNLDYIMLLIGLIALLVLRTYRDL